MIDGQVIDAVPRITANGLQRCFRKLNHIDWPLTSYVIVDENQVSGRVVELTFFHKGRSH